MEIPGPTYEHVPLMSDGSTFRIITIFPGKEDERIECGLLEVPTLSNPTYSALSYCWGDDTVAGHIWISGRVMDIRENLRNALKRIRDTEIAQSFWIDALCIAQKDEAGEKSTQIPLMRHIYSKSYLVRIYLGGEYNGSGQMPSLFDCIDDACDQREVIENGASFRQKALPPYKYDELGLPPPRDSAWEALRFLLSRDWFSRVWIIQEVILATSAEVICGQWAMSWTRFLFTIFKAHALGIEINPNEVNTELHPTRPGNPLISVTQLLFFNTLKPADSGFIPWKLIDLLHHTRASSATRPHDYCYGVLGLSEELGSPDLTIDYMLPPEAVYLHFARYFVNQGDGVKVLYNTSVDSLCMPSWVPDWSDRYLSIPRLVPQPRRAPVSNPAVAAASSFAAVIQLHPSNPDILKVRGIVFGVIDELGDVYQSPRMVRTQRTCTPVHISMPVNINNCNSPLPDGQEQRADLEDISVVADCINELYQLLNRGNTLRYPTGEDSETVVWRTLICNHARRSGEKAPGTYVDLYRSLLCLIKAHDFTRQKPPRYHLESLSFEDVLSQDPAQVFLNARVIISQALGVCYSKRRGRTEHGYVGQFCLNVQVGDCVYIPLGSAVPYVIRPGSNKTYRLIGECYVHGIMNGEAFHISGASIVDLDLE